MPELRFAEDTHVDLLWADAPHTGATLLAATFARTYIDANRPEDDVDVSLLSDPWPHPVNPSHKTKLGFGLVWRQVKEGVAIYDRRLSAAELHHRIEQYWRPYQNQLHVLADALHQRWGSLWHLNLHSMPSNAYQRLGIESSRPLADFVLGDLDGTTCEPTFVDVIEGALRACGYSVARNDPYKGQDLIRRMGKPGQHRHSLQVEVNRALYMDEATREPNEHFDGLRRNLAEVSVLVAEYIRHRLPNTHTRTLDSQKESS